MIDSFKEKFPTNEACQTLSCIPEKFIVDFANGIDVAKDHLRSQKNRSFFTRIKEGVSGQSSVRQHAINQSFSDGIEASLKWLTELTSSLATTNYALKQVNDRVTSLMSDTVILTHYAADTRAQLNAFSVDVNKRLSEIQGKINNLEMVQNGNSHLDDILSSWRAGRFAALPLAGRCYVVLEELRWGAFGDVIRQGEKAQVKQMINRLKDKMVVQLAQDHEAKPDNRYDSKSWLAWPSGKLQKNDWTEAINWLGDWSNENTHPITWSITQKYDNLPLGMPRISSARRISDSMVDEIFAKERA